MNLGDECVQCRVFLSVSVTVTHTLIISLKFTKHLRKRS